MHEILDRDAHEQCTAIASGQVSAEELMRATLSQIDAVNGRVNAIVELRDAKPLLAEARAMDAGPNKGALHGLPIAVKNLEDVVGMPTSQGSPVFAGHVAGADGLYVSRMRAAGAIFIGKTNTPEFGLGSQTYNPVHGETCNPYDVSRTCGGSSGGAAVALATRMVALADGSDAMGSLRNPAGWNNVYGMRPSWGRVPRSGDGDVYLHQLSTNGPMARSPRDLALLLDVLAGPDPRQPLAMAYDAMLPVKATAQGKRIGWLADWGGSLPFENGILDLCRDGLAVMEKLGCNVEPITPPFSRDALWEAWTTLRSWSNATSLGELYDDPKTRDQLKPDAIWEIERGRSLSAIEVHAASVIRSQWFVATVRMFESFDAVAMPTAQVWPFPLNETWPREIAGQGMDTYHRWMECMIPASLIGLPVVAVPVGFGASGLPMGIQLIGPYKGDRGVLGLAQSYHDATDWPGQCPPV